MVALQTTSSLPSTIKCRDLCVEYRGVRAIDQLTGEFSAGSLTAIIGPNGGGKSTFLKTLKGILKPCQGSIDTDSLQDRQVAYLPQNPDIDRSFPISVADVVSQGLYSKIGFYKAFTKSHQEKVRQALADVCMEDYYHRPISTLSGGQFQRILFARISLQDASVILLDEPFAAIDAPTMELLATVLQGWREDGRTIIAVLHDLDIVRDFFPQTLILARKVIGWGETKEVLTLKSLRQAKAQCARWEAYAAAPWAEAA